MNISKFENIRELYERDKGICHLCHKSVPPEEATRDHIIPLKRLKGLSEGERNDIGKGGRNLALAHRKCNHERGYDDISGYPAPFFASNIPKNGKVNEHSHAGNRSRAAKKCLAASFFVPCPCLVCVCIKHISYKSNLCQSCSFDIHREIRRAP